MAPAARCTLQRRRLLPAVLALACCALLQAPAARAVLIDGGDGTGNTTAPPDDPGWDHVASRGGFTAVYLGNGYVLTAQHVPAGTVVIDGTTYSMIESTSVRLENGDGSQADLKVVALAGVPPLPLLPLRSTPPSPGDGVIMAGNGRDRGPGLVSCDPDPMPPPKPLGGYAWLTSKTLRWGTNQVEGLLAFDDVTNETGTELFYTSFDEGVSPDEAQGATGDSGGAVFIDAGFGWELAGIMVAISCFPQCQPCNPPEEPLDRSIYTSFTFAADLSHYRDQIEDIVALPEPDGVTGLVCGAALLALLARSRRRA